MQTMVPAGADRIWAEDSEGAGPALVLLHSGVAGARLWDPVWPELAAAFRVIRYDSRGYGRSPAATEPYAELEDLRAVLDHFGLERAHLTGCSQGGGTAAELALAEPARVRSLVLLCPGFAGYTWPEPDPELAAQDEALAAAEPGPWSIRPAGPADADFLADMLVEAVNWSPRWNQSRESALATPAVAHYVSGWPRDTDLGVVAVTGGQPVGAAWLRFLAADDPGYGFVAPDVPELTIGVTPLWRGRGVGRALLRAIAGRAREHGIQRISLSVERKNFAQQLYRAEGYQVVDSSDKASDTMVKDL
jgi:pimeloyl-ACP methyl ester carboxylesterase